MKRWNVFGSTCIFDLRVLIGKHSQWYQNFFRHDIQYEKVKKPYPLLTLMDWTLWNYIIFVKEDFGYERYQLWGTRILFELLIIVQTSHCFSKLSPYISELEMNKVFTWLCTLALILAWLTYFYTDKINIKIYDLIPLHIHTLLSIDLLLEPGSWNSLYNLHI